MLGDVKLNMREVNKDWKYTVGQVMHNISNYGSTKSLLITITIIGAFIMSVTSGLCGKAEGLWDKVMIYSVSVIVVFIGILLIILIAQLIKTINDSYKIIKLSIAYTNSPKCMEEALDINIDTVYKYLMYIQNIFGTEDKLIKMHLNSIVNIAYDLFIYQIENQGIENILGNYVKDTDLNSMYKEYKKEFNMLIELCLMHIVSNLSKTELSDENIFKKLSAFIEIYLINNQIHEDKTKKILEQLLSMRYTIGRGLYE